MLLKTNPELSKRFFYVAAKGISVNNKKSFQRTLTTYYWLDIQEQVLHYQWNISDQWCPSQRAIDTEPFLLLLLTWTTCWRNSCWTIKLCYQAICTSHLWYRILWYHICKLLNKQFSCLIFGIKFVHPMTLWGPVESTHKEPDMHSLDILIDILIKLLNNEQMVDLPDIWKHEIYLSDRKPQVTSGFHSQRTSHEEISCLL